MQNPKYIFNFSSVKRNSQIISSVMLFDNSINLATRELFRFCLIFGQSE